MRFGQFGFDDGAGEVDPGFAVVEDDAIAAGHDRVGFFQFRIRIVQELNIPVPLVLLGELADEGFQSATVGDGAVEEPFCVSGVYFREEMTDEFDGGYRFCYLSICSVYACEVPEGAVPAF